MRLKISSDAPLFSSQLKRNKTMKALTLTLFVLVFGFTALAQNRIETQTSPRGKLQANEKVWFFIVEDSLRFERIAKKTFHDYRFADSAHVYQDYQRQDGATEARTIVAMNYCVNVRTGHKYGSCQIAFRRTPSDPLAEPIPGSVVHHLAVHRHYDLELARQTGKLDKTKACRPLYPKEECLRRWRESREQKAKKKCAGNKKRATNQ